MHSIKSLAVNVLLASTLTGCALLGGGADPEPLRVQPSMGITQGGPAAMLNYQLGRYHHSRLDYERATASYRDALLAEPGHVEARNGLAIVAAMQGRYDEAMRELRAAIVLAPDAAHLHNNLGYVHTLRGAHSEAVAEYAAATRLEPGNARAAENLALARSRLDSSQSVPPTQAKTAASPPPAFAAPAPARSEPRIVPVTRQIFEIQAPSQKLAPVSTQTSLASTLAPQKSGVAPAPAPAGTMPAAAAPSPIRPAQQARIEVANGNGLNGFAKMVSRQLAEQGVRVDRLTNQLPYEQAATQIHYRTGHTQAAAALAMRLRPGITLVASSSLHATTDVRLILGRDAWTAAALLRKNDPINPVQLAAIR
jgi:Flp pilus assembly protein TadD